MQLLSSPPSSFFFMALLDELGGQEMIKQRPAGQTTSEDWKLKLVIFSDKATDLTTFFHPFNLSFHAPARVIPLARQS